MNNWARPSTDITEVLESEVTEVGVEHVGVTSNSAGACLDNK